MGYNNKNYWQRIIDIQDWVLELQEEHLDIKMKTIHKKFVFPKYRICYKTFSKYMGINAKRELTKYLEKEQKIKEKEKQQFKMDLE